MTKRRDVFKFITAALLPAAAGNAGARLPNEVLGAAKARLIREPFGDLRIYFDGSTEQLRVLTAGSLALKPGQTPHPPHAHPEEEIMLITEGTGEISLDGRTIKVRPGDMMYCAAGKLHGVVNTGRRPLVFFFYKWISF